MTAFWILSACTLVIDRVTKILAQNGMTLGKRIIVLGGVFELRYTHNTGMALGFLSGYTVAGIILPLLAVGAGALVLRRYQPSRFVLVASGLILGGFLGNFLDRVFLGYVVDMIYFPWLPFFICNAADIAITFGAALIAISLLFRPQDWKTKQEQHSMESGETNDTNQ